MHQPSHTQEGAAAVYLHESRLSLWLPPLLHCPLSLCQKKEKSESERLLTEQLQAKELELLQLRTEMETSQGTGRARMFTSDCKRAAL